MNVKTNIDMKAAITTMVTCAAVSYRSALRVSSLMVFIVLLFDESKVYYALSQCKQKEIYFIYFIMDLLFIVITLYLCLHEREKEKRG